MQNSSLLQSRFRFYLFISIFSSMFIISIYGCKKDPSDINKETSTETTGVSDPQNELLEKGRKLYVIYCGNCHGMDGATPLEGQALLNISTLNLDEIIEVTRIGRNTMTGYRTILDEDELNAVAAFTLQLQE